MSVLLLKNPQHDVVRSHSWSHCDPDCVWFVRFCRLAKLIERLQRSVRIVYKATVGCPRMWNGQTSQSQAFKILSHLHHINGILAALVSSSYPLHLLLQGHLQHHNLKLWAQLRPENGAVN